MRKQKAFNIAWNHFIVDKNPASYVIGDKGKFDISCRYRGPNGARCALGLFIPDEFYKIGMEGQTCRYVLSLLKTAGYQPFLDVDPGDGNNIYSNLQCLHDSAVSISIDRGVTFHEVLEGSMRALATRERLVIPGG